MRLCSSTRGRFIHSSHLQKKNLFSKGRESEVCSARARVTHSSHEPIFKNLANTSSDPFLNTSTPRAGSNVRPAGRDIVAYDFDCTVPGRAAGVGAASGRDNGEIFPFLIWDWDILIDVVGECARKAGGEGSETVNDTSSDGLTPIARGSATRS